MQNYSTYRLTPSVGESHLHDVQVMIDPAALMRNKTTTKRENTVEYKVRLRNQRCLLNLQKLDFSDSRDLGGDHLAGQPWSLEPRA